MINNKEKRVRKLAVLFGLLLTTSVFAHMPGENTEPLPGANEIEATKNATEAQKDAIRKAAADFCGDIDDDDEKQECSAEFYANHNLDEEPSCD